MEYGVLGQSSLRSLFDKRFLGSPPGFGVYNIGPDTVDIGIHPHLAWMADEPFSFPEDGRFVNPEFWGKYVDASKVVLRPGQTLVAWASVGLDLLEHYAFFSPRSRMARVGVAATANVMGFSQKNWAKHVGRNGPIRAEILVSITSRIPVTGLTKEPLLQMRVFQGDTRVRKAELMDILRSGHDLLIDPTDGLPLSKADQANAVDDDGKLVTRVYLREGLVGFKLKKNTPVLDISISTRQKDWKKFFEPVYAKRDGQGRLYVDLYGGEYYLLITREGLNLPVGYVASLEQLDSRLINAVVHFAEYFGHAFKGAATLEVVPVESFIRVYQGSPIGAFRLERVEPGTPKYKGFSLNQHLLPQLPPMFTLPEE